MTTYPNLVAGERVKTVSVSPDMNPSDRSDVVGGFAMGDAAQVDRAVEAALAAQPA